MPSDDKQLARECQVFSRYLSGRAADAYVLEKYCDAHRRKTSFATTTAFDRFLLGLATIHPGFTTIADGYARFFAPGGVMRKKLVLVLAILESSRESQQFLECTDSNGLAVLALAFLGRVVPLAVGLVLAVAILLPLQVAVGASRMGK